MFFIFKGLLAAVECQQHLLGYILGIGAAAQVAVSQADASDVIYAPTDNTIASAGGTVDGVCRAAGVPVISGEENACKVFGVATLSISYYNLGVTTGKMAIEILKGEKNISEMPIAYDEAPVKKYNKELCVALNLTLPAGYVAIGE